MDDLQYRREQFGVHGEEAAQWDYLQAPKLTLLSGCNFELEDKMPNLKVGDPAPDFTLKDSNGQTVRLADLRGRKVLLYFFTSPGGGN